MLKQVLTAFSFVCLATQAFADCEDITLDRCTADHPFQSLKSGTEEACQLFCNEVFSGLCTFFIYDRQQDICQVYDYGEQEYAASCARIGSTPKPSFADCEVSDENCVVRLYLIV